MKTILHKAETRGHFNHGWLNTWHTFSFARYHNPERIHFGALRVLNDDIIAPSEGFGRHPHDNMEIITIPLEGKVLHRDSMGNDKYIFPGEVQVMSAGTGIFHEEYNGSNIKPLKLLQIWIYPNKKNIKPTYSQAGFDAEKAVNCWQKIVTRNDKNTLHIYQDAKISRVFLTKGSSIDYKLNKTSFGCYLFIIDGEIKIEKTNLENRDGIGIYETDEFEITATEDSFVLNLEVPQL